MENNLQAIDKLAEALAVAQAEMEAAVKDSNNPFFKSAYADLNSVIQAIKKPLANNGLSYTQLLTTANTVKTILMHKSGQFLVSEMPLINTKGDMQGLGSAVTYARRYTLQAIVGLSAEDDDGNQASGKNGHKEEKKDSMPSNVPDDGYSEEKSGKAKDLAVLMSSYLKDEKLTDKEKKEIRLGFITHQFKTLETLKFKSLTELSITTINWLIKKMQEKDVVEAYRDYIQGYIQSKK